MPLINFTNEELYKIECCIEGDGDNYKSFCDPLIKNIIDKIQNAYLVERDTRISKEETN